jgi:hypothetical protein
MNCGICGRTLENPADALSSDCSGDCWGCIGEVEADSEHEPSLETVKAEYAAGLRPNLVFRPKITFNFILSHSANAKVETEITLSKPNGELWAAEIIVFRLVCLTPKKTFRSVSQEKDFITNILGVIKFDFTVPDISKNEKLFAEFSVRETKWLYSVVNPNG